MLVGPGLHGAPRARCGLALKAGDYLALSGASALTDDISINRRRFARNCQLTVFGFDIQGIRGDGLNIRGLGGKGRGWQPPWSNTEPGRETVSF